MRDVDALDRVNMSMAVGAPLAPWLEHRAIRSFWRS